MARRAKVLAALLATLAGCCASSGHERPEAEPPLSASDARQPKPHGHGEGPPERAEREGHGDQATVHHRFDDAELWAARFEDPGRDAWQRPDRVLKLLALEEDAKIADIGAATGYFPVRFARAAPRGVVYGLDIEPNLVNFLNLRARREALPNLVSLVCADDDAKIPEPVDLVFVCDTYHHIGDRVAYFERLKAKLRPGGRLAIVDFKKGDFPVGPKDSMKLPPEKVVAELEEAGYRLVKRDDDLPYQYVLLLEPR